MAKHGQESGGTVPVKSSRTCVVYDPDSGRVHHVHRVVTLEDGQEPSERQIEAHAMEILKRKGRSTEKLKALHLPSDKVEMQQLMSVDPKTGSLISKPKS